MICDRRKRLSGCCGCGIILLLSMLLALLVFYWLVLPPLQWLFGTENTQAECISCTGNGSEDEWKGDETVFVPCTAEDYTNDFGINSADLPAPPPPPPPPAIPVLPAEEGEN